MWINEQTLSTFILHSDIRYECYKDNKLMPAILDDVILAANGYAVVTQVIPTYDAITHGLTPQAPVKGEDGKWTLGYDVVELDPAIAANNRNKALVMQLEGIQSAIRWGNQDAITAILNNNTAAIDAWKIKLAELQAELAALEAQL